MAEREVKLEAPPSFAVPDLGGLGLQTRPHDPETLDAIYFDTEDLRLARWRCSLRWRSDSGWTVKLPSPDGAKKSGWLSRIEQTFPGERGTPPAEALDLLSAYLRSRPVRPVARLRTRRRATEVFDAEGKQVAELDDDEVSVLDGRRIALRFRELEVELTPSAPDDAASDIVELLRSAGASEPNPAPKIVRALGPRATEEPELTSTSPGKQSTIAEVLTHALGTAVIRVIRNDAGIRLDDPDPERVHQARVGTRRFRTFLKEFESLFDQNWNKALRKEAKDLADALGAVRDADVMLARRQKHVDSLPAGERSGALAVVNRLHDDREAARKKLLATLREESYTRLLDHMVAGAKQPRFAEDADRPAKGLIDYAVQAFSKLKEAVGELDPDPPPSDLHRVRILTKRARYVAEALVPVAGKDAARFADRASDLQDVLGELQDSTVAGDWLNEFARSTPLAAFIAGKLAGLEIVAGQAARGQWRDAWEKLDRKKITGWLSG